MRVWIRVVRCLVGQEGHIWQVIQWKRCNLFAQIKINLSWKMILDYWSETQALATGSGRWEWGFGEITAVLTDHLQQILHTILFITWSISLAGMKKKSHYVLHMKDQALLWSTCWWAPAVISPDPNQTLAIARSRTFLFIFYQDFSIFVLLSENQMQDVSQLHYHFLQD